MNLKGIFYSFKKDYTSVFKLILFLMLNMILNKTVGKYNLVSQELINDQLHSMT